MVLFIILVIVPDPEVTPEVGTFEYTECPIAQSAGIEFKVTSIMAMLLT